MSDVGSAASNVSVVHAAIGLAIFEYCNMHCGIGGSTKGIA